MMKRSLSELLRIKRDTELAVRGAEVLEKMENALTKEQLELQGRARALEAECAGLMRRIEDALERAKEDAVLGDIERLIAQERIDNLFTIGYKKKFGKLISEMRKAGPGPRPPAWGAPLSYEGARSLADTLSAKIIELGNTQSELAFIESELAKTRRRVNALRKVIVPDLEAQKKSLEEWIDEETREELGRRRWIEGVVFG